VAETVSELQSGLRAFLVDAASPDRVRRDDEEHNPPLDLVRELGRLGYLCVGIPAEYGGAGGMLEMVEVMEELGRHYLGLGQLAGRVMYAEQLLVTLGRADQKDRWLPGLAAGDVIFSISFTEPDAGSDLSALRTRATPVEGGFVVNGQKVFSSSFGYADVALLLARTEPHSSGRDGLTAFLIDPHGPGIETRALTTLGDWTNRTYEVFYTDVAVPADNILGEIGTGWAVARRHLARERLMMAARAIGATAAVLEQTADFVSTRTQFGHPLAQFQVVRHKLADISIELLMARAGLYEVARRVGDGDGGPDAARVKIYASELYARASTTALQLHGGAGYTRDLPLQRHVRDAPMYVIGGGSAEVLRDVVSRDLLRRRPAPPRRTQPD
jgi:alkylation response protein AidB-like acyl-CoA dehydrogenase